VKIAHSPDNVDVFSLEWNTSSKVKADAERFRKAANQVYKALHDRIQRENRHLYPLAEQV